MKLLPIVIAISTATLTACSSSHANDNSKAVEQLIKDTESHMVFVKGGSFQMGDFGPIQPDGKGLRWSDHQDNQYLHKVTLDDFYISDRQVSYSDYDIYTQAVGKDKIVINNYILKNSRLPNLPAGVNWYQAHDYCKWLAEKTGKYYSLPTEAQWEYAARSRGKFLPYATDDGTIKMGKNYPSREERKKLTPDHSPYTPYPIAKKYPSNPLGIYQMGLNGYEWVIDWYDKDYYKKSPKKNPKGPSKGLYKVRRGGPTGETIFGILTINRSPAFPDLTLRPPEGSTAKINRKDKEPNSINTFRCAIND